MPKRQKLNRPNSPRDLLTPLCQSLLSHIASFLGPRQAVIFMSSFKKSNIYWAEVDASTFPTLTSLERLLEHSKRSLQVFSLVCPEVQTGESVLIRGFPGLHSLHLTGYKSDNMETLDFLRGAPNLVNIAISYCGTISSLEGLRHCGEVETLILRSSDRDDDGPRVRVDLLPLVHCKKLSQLELSGLDGRLDLGPLAQLPELSLLKLAEVIVDSFNPLAACPLTSLALYEMDLTGLERLHSTTLEQLRIQECDNFDGLELDISHLDVLELATMDIEGLTGLIENTIKELIITDSNIGAMGLEGITGLTKLSITDCRVEEFTAGMASDLTEVFIHRTDVGDFNFSHCFNLARANFCGLPLENLSSLKNCHRLEELNINGCAELTSLEPLAGLRSLKKLMMNFCTGITDYEPLTRCPALHCLSVRGCLISKPVLEKILALPTFQKITFDAPDYKLYS